MPPYSHDPQQESTYGSLVRGDVEDAHGLADDFELVGLHVVLVWYVGASLPEAVGCSGGDERGVQSEKDLCHNGVSTCLSTSVLLSVMRSE